MEDEEFLVLRLRGLLPLCHLPMLLQHREGLHGETANCLAVTVLCKSWLQAERRRHRPGVV
jgi:hypothetical protein